MANIIDRRLNPRDKTIKNRQKFIERSREQIKRAVRKSVDEGSIADIENEKIKVKVKGMNEPTFRKDPKTGDKRYVLPGNTEHVVGDRQKKPPEGDGSGGSAGGLGRGEDEFEFVLNKSEYLDFLFDDLELPDMLKRQMQDITVVKPKRAGYTNVGNPSQLDVVRSLKNSLGRRIGLHRPNDEDIERLEAALQTAKDINDSEQILWLEHQITELRKRQVAIPWLDPFDIRYRNFTPQPQSITKAVMFCVMDVSGSMTEKLKDMAKRFFVLLHMWLVRKYERVEIVFVKHHEEASEVDEENFFYSRESGGTVVSSAINLVDSIIDERYNVQDWNIYVAQCSDGDNFSSDKEATLAAMDALLPSTQYFAYIEVRNVMSLFSAMIKTDLWRTYEPLQQRHQQLHMDTVHDEKDIWKVFRSLFAKQSVGK